MSGTISRRQLIRLIGGGALGLALSSRLPAKVQGSAATCFSPNVYLRIDASGQVLFWVKKAEMGQQIHTAIAAIVIDELGADPNSLQLRQAPTQAQFDEISTGGSFAIPAFWTHHRPLLAAAREMLETAAAKRWQVDPAELHSAEGWVCHRPSGRRLAFAELVADAARLTPPEHPRLREQADWRQIGRAAGRRDAADIVSGKLIYGADMRLPGLRFAAIAKSPSFAGKVVGYQRDAALAVGGVEQVVATEEWVAVVARNSWAAFRGRDQLQVKWQPTSAGSALTDQRIMADLKQTLSGDGHRVRQNGLSLQGEEIEILDCRYQMPMAQHAALEPVNATALVADGRCTLWAPVQTATALQQEVARMLDLATDKVTVHTTALGGSFGRKLERGFALEAAQIAAQVEGPVQLIYTREDDMTQGGVRPPSCHHLRFQIQRKSGRIGLTHRYAVASPFAQQDPSQLAHRGFDWTGALGSGDIPYAFDHLEVTQREGAQTPIPLNWWRGTFRNHHAFASECALDELAEQLGEDPLALRLRLLSEDVRAETFPQEISHLQVARLRAVLQSVAEAIDYAAKRPPGRAVGVACHAYSDVGTYVAHALEVSVREQRLRIHRVVAAVDCGIAVNPDAIRAQMEGAVIFGLSSALWGEVSIEDGAIRTANFDRCRLLRLNQAPPTEVLIVASELAPGGMGEPPLPSVTPALLNAIARAGGPRIRELPVGSRLALESA